MRKPLCLPLFLLLAAVVRIALWAGEPLCDLAVIDQRAGEIAAALERCDTPLIPPITERGSWEALLVSEEGKQLIKDAEKYLEQAAGGGGAAERSAKWQLVRLIRV